MSGTTLCPHCVTRFRIYEVQMASHHGMVRCGHCLQAFDARPGYIPDLPNPQLELPIQFMPDNLPAAQAVEERTSVENTASVDASAGKIAENQLLKSTLDDRLDFTHSAQDLHTEPLVQPQSHADPEDANSPQIAGIADVDETNALSASVPPLQLADEPPFHFMTLAEQVAIVHDVEDEHPSPPRRWSWVIAAFLLLLVLLAQAVYFFRIDIAARLPQTRPVLTDACRLLGCGIPLPQRSDLMSIESSDIVADPVHENLIALNILLRNHAPYAQAYPILELALNDSRDKPLARRIFKPEDYLSPAESASAGMPPNHEFSLKLHLDTADLKPSGYRLALYYVQQ